MEPALIIALVLAFGVRPDVGGPPMPRTEVLERLGDAVMILGAQVALVVAYGRLLARRARRAPDGSAAPRRTLALGHRALGLMAIGTYAYLIFGEDWPGVVERGLGLRGGILVDELLILAPFLVLRLATWWALYPAERLIRAPRRPIDEGVGGHLLRRCRQSLGLVLPAILIYCLGNDLVARVWPEAMESPYTPIVGMFAMGAFVLVGAPAFVRLTWPTRRLPHGPLRDRLERLARRLGFRYSDILVWETHGAFVNAGVTGALPWYRYVLLTDTLIENLDDREIEAVFGHEIGHIAHRHLTFFGLFLLGSLGIMALVVQAVDWLGPEGWLEPLGLEARSAMIGLTIQSTVVLACLGGYFLFVFGLLSRRFERQADLYGCRAVSCGRADCPPHLDLDAIDLVPPPTLKTVCPVGIRIFANALAHVAQLNGMEPKARSWRHGSIARRIAFLEALEGRPDRERRFQQRVVLLRLTLLAVLGAAFVAAARSRAFEQL